MSPDQLFSIAGALASLGWLLLVVVPKRPLSVHVAGLFIPMLLAGLYLFLIATHLRDSEGGFGSLDQVAQLFSKRELLLAGWIHYLCFDLFIGAWELRDSQANDIPHLVVIPCLLMTFMLGPIGLLFYLLIRSAKLRNVSVS